MSNWLAKVYKHHKEWIKIANIYGVGDYSEDLVQDVYIKLDKYASERKLFTNGTINKGYVFFAIKNAANTWHNKNAKRCDNYDYEERNIETECTKDEQHAWGRFCDKVEETSKDWKWSDKQVFDEYRLTKTSMRKLGAKYDISWVSIFTTIKGCKTKLREELHEDYKNYQEGNYEEIKVRGQSGQGNESNGHQKDSGMDSGGGLRMQRKTGGVKQIRVPLAIHKGPVPNPNGIRVAASVHRKNKKHG